MEAEPKAAVDNTALPFRSRKDGAARFAAFCEKFVTVPKGEGARGPLRLRNWQKDLVGSIFDPDPRPRIAGWMLPRGQGKTTLVAALGLYDLMLGEEGASVVVAATDERQAGLCFRAAARMVELNEDLAARVQVYQDRPAVPARGAWFHVLHAVPKRLEGLDPTLAILDEVGVIDREVYEVVSLASGKRESSLVLGIGTPGPDPDNSVLLDMRTYAASTPTTRRSCGGSPPRPGSRTIRWIAGTAGSWPTRPWVTSCSRTRWWRCCRRRCAKVPSAERKCQLAHEVDEPWLPPGTWDACTDARSIPDGTTVVLALDGSFSQDCTAVVAVSLEDTPHIDVAELWEPPANNPDYRVPVVDVEHTIREACRRWHVRRSSPTRSGGPAHSKH